MPARVHRYGVRLAWTGNTGEGTRRYAGYERRHEISVEGKPVIPGSSDPAFRGDPSRYNPEELLLAAASGCHMLWYLHLCSDAGIVVLRYEDRAEGVMEEAPDGSGRFTRIRLVPTIGVPAGTDIEKARALHGVVSPLCPIANTLAIPVEHAPVFEILP